MKLKLHIHFLFFFICLISIKSMAQDGSLDLSFSGDGKATTAIGTFDDEARAMAIQSDGKILVAGHSYQNGNYDFAVVRYNTDGSLDTTFNVDGLLTTPIASGDEKAKAIALQTDGKIIVAGYTYNGSVDAIAVVRYNTDGRLDTTFDNDGIAIASSAYNQYAQGIAIQNDGKIVVAGGVYNNNNFDAIVLRYTANGTLDNTFDGDGIVHATISANFDDYANAIEIQSDGKIVIAGYAKDAIDADVMLCRYTTNGILDTTFDGDGIVITPVWGNFNEYGNALAIQTDGRLVVTGNTNNSFYDFVTLRYNANGSLDTSFDNDGVVVTDFGTGTDFANAVDIAIQNDGKVLVAGYFNNATLLNFALARYTINGNIDSTFDADGIVTTAFGGSGNDAGYAIAIQPDAKILVAGASYSTQNNIALARYNSSVVNTTINKPLVSGTKKKIIVNTYFSQTFFCTDLDLINATLIVFNSAGQKVEQVNGILGKTFYFQHSNLSHGMYYFQLIQNNELLFADKLIISNK